MTERDSSKKVGTMVRLEPQVLASLRADAQRKRTSVSELIRSCIRDALLPIQDDAINVRLEHELVGTLKAQARRTGRSLPAVIRSATRTHYVFNDLVINSLPARIIDVPSGQFEEYLSKVGKDAQEVFCALPNSSVINLDAPLWKNLLDQGTRIRFVFPQSLLAQVGPDLRKLNEYSLSLMGAVKAGFVDDKDLDETYIGISCRNTYHSFITMRHNNQNDTSTMIYVLLENSEAVSLSGTADAAWEMADKTSWLAA